MNASMAESGFTIRQALVSDASALLEIYTPFVLNTTVTFEITPPTCEEFAERIAVISSEFPYLVAEFDGQAVGYAYAHRYRERAAYRFDAELSVYIAPSYHRHGLGRAMYNIITDILREQNYHTAYAVIALPNQPSTGFHEDYGFTFEGRSRNVGYKFGRWLDTVTYSMQLLPYDSVPNEPIPVNKIDLHKFI